MKIISWNVNGIRACIKKGFLDFVKKHKPDILCLQESRGYQEDIDSLLPQYTKYWYHAEKKGYSGTAIFVRENLIPKKIVMGIGKKEHDKEGRVLSIEYENFYLICVYTPNSGEALKRLEYRKKWDKVFCAYIKKLDKKKPLVICGDLNVAHTEIDLANPKSNERSPGYTIEERDGFSKIIANNFIDSFRHFYPAKKEQYTWWSYRSNARSRNVGWRIDYFMLSKRLIPHLKKAFILAEVMGSDHCPVGIKLINKDI